MKIENILLFPFNEKLAKTKVLSRMINVNFEFSFDNNLKNILISNVPKNNTSCMYKSLCDDCGPFYIGQPCKSLSIFYKNFST